MGILKEKKFYNKDDMKDKKIEKGTTEQLELKNHLFMILCPV